MKYYFTEQRQRAVMTIFLIAVLAFSIVRLTLYSDKAKYVILFASILDFSALFVTIFFHYLACTIMNATASKTSSINITSFILSLILPGTAMFIIIYTGNSAEYATAKALIVIGANCTVPKGGNSCEIIKSNSAEDNLGLSDTFRLLKSNYDLNDSAVGGITSYIESPTVGIVSITIVDRRHVIVISHNG